MRFEAFEGKLKVHLRSLWLVRPFLVIFENTKHWRTEVRAVFEVSLRFLDVSHFDAPACEEIRPSFRLAPADQRGRVSGSFPAGTSSFSLIRTPVRFRLADIGVGLTKARLVLNHASYLIEWAAARSVRDGSVSNHPLPRLKCPGADGFF